MRIPAAPLSDLACEISMAATDGVMGHVDGDLDDLCKLELAIAIKRAILTKQKKLVIDIVYPTARK